MPFVVEAFISHSGTHPKKSSLNHRILLGTRAIPNLFLQIRGVAFRPRMTRMRLPALLRESARLASGNARRLAPPSSSRTQGRFHVLDALFDTGFIQNWLTRRSENVGASSPSQSERDLAVIVAILADSEQQVPISESPVSHWRSAGRTEGLRK